MKTATLFLILIFPVSLSAQPFYKNKWWWIGRGVSAAAIAADAISTNSLTSRYPAGGDNFPFFTPNTPGKIVGASFIDLGYSTAFSIIEYHVSAKLSRPWRFIAYTEMPITDGIAHGWATSHNYSVLYDCTHAHLTCN